MNIYQRVGPNTAVGFGGCGTFLLLFLLWPFAIIGAAAFIAWLVFWVVPKSLVEELDGKAGWITAGVWLSIFTIGPFLIFGVLG